MNKRVDVFVATGQHTYSGTGRNRQTTRHVALHSNYALIPGEIDIVNAKGRAMKRHEKAKVITSYWSEMGELSEYKVYLEGDGVKPPICTKLGIRPLGH